MNKVFVQIINPILGSCTSATIEDPVVPEIKVTNALKYFGIDKVNWNGVGSVEVFGKERNLITKTGIVEETCKVVIVSFYQ